MAESINTSSIKPLEKVLKEDQTKRQEYLTIEFLQNLIRKSLASFVNAEYPLLDFNRINQMVHSAVIIQSAYLETDTVKIAEQIVQSSNAERKDILQELSSKLIERARETLGRFLHYTELRIRGEEVTGGDILEGNSGRYGLSKEDLAKLLDRYKDPESKTGKNIVQEVMRVYVGGRAWKVKLIGYVETQNKMSPKNEKLFTKVKEKLMKIKEQVRGKLSKIAKFLKTQPAQSPVAIEIKPFLKGALDKLKFVEKLAQAAFLRLAGSDLSEIAAQNMIQTLDSEIDALVRYVNKVEKIFNNLLEKNTGESMLIDSEAMLLTPEDEAQMAEPQAQVNETDQLAPELLSNIDFSEPEDDLIIPKGFDRDIKWSIKKRSVNKNDMDHTQDNIQRPRASLFTKLFSKILGPKKHFSSLEIKQTEAISSKLARQVDLYINEKTIWPGNEHKQHKQAGKRTGRFF
ncbi:hypothetical protein ACFL5G_05695 [Candidatus Margulisiibacteriota bacterium]